MSLSGLHPATAVRIQILDGVASGFDYDVAITSLTDGHPKGGGGYHPWGLAWDWQLAHFNRDDPANTEYFAPGDLSETFCIAFESALRYAIGAEVQIIRETAKRHWHGENEIKLKFPPGSAA